MSIPKNDLALIMDIYECCLNIFDLTKGMRAYTFEKDKKTRWAVERQFEILGVASNKVSKETREQLSNIPWSSMIGLRNVIAHDYGDIVIEKIWYTIKNSLPVLKKELLKLQELKKTLKNINVII